MDVHDQTISANPLSPQRTLGDFRNSERVRKTMSEFVTKAMEFSDLANSCRKKFASAKGVLELCRSIEDGDTFSLRDSVLATGNLEVQNRQGETLLVLAAKKGFTDLVRFLLQRGVDPNIADNDGYTAFVWTCQKRDVQRAAFPCASVARSPDA